MTRRNILMIPILFVITFGIYGLYWFYSTSNELIRYNKSDENSFVWLLFALIPIVNMIAVWKHSQAIKSMSENKVNGVMLFAIWIILPPVAMIWTQAEMNKLAA